MRPMLFSFYLIIISCFFISTFSPAKDALATSKVKVSGTGCQDIGNKYTIPQAKDIAEKKAIENALKSIIVFSKSDFHDIMGKDSESEYQFVISLMESIVVGRIEKPIFSEFYEKGKNVFCRDVTGLVDPHEIKQLIDEFIGVDSLFNEEFEKELAEYEQAETAVNRQANRIDSLEKDIAEIEGEIKHAKFPSGSWAIAKTRLEEAEDAYNRIKRMYDEDAAAVDLKMLEKRLVTLKEAKETFADEEAKIQMLETKWSKLTLRRESDNLQIEKLKKSLTVVRDNLLTFVMNYPIVQIAPGESESGKMKSVNEKNRDAEKRAVELSQKIAANRMYCRINRLPSSVLEALGRMGNLKEDLRLKEKIFIDEHGRPSSEPIWQTNKGYGKAVAIVKATFVWEGNIPTLADTEKVEPKKKETPERKSVIKKKYVPLKKSWSGFSIGVEKFSVNSLCIEYRTNNEKSVTMAGNAYVLEWEILPSNEGWSCGVDLRLFLGEASGHLIELTPRFRTQPEWLFDGYLDYILGIGWSEWWDLYDIGCRADDEYKVYYMKLGVQLIPAVFRERFRLVGGLKLPILAELDRYYSSSIEEFEGDYSFYGSVDCRLTESWAISLYYDSYHFKETDKFPRRERNTTGLKLIYLVR